MNRGRFLFSASGAMAAMAGFAAGALRAVAQPLAGPNDPRVLWIRNVTTHEEVRAAFTLDGHTLNWPAYREICWLLRDGHVGPQQGFVTIDIRTIEGLFEVQRLLQLQGYNEPLIVNSGFRTPGTNEAVGGRPCSYHLQGRAVDFYAPGVGTDALERLCQSVPIVGGIGYYRDGHVHVDSGPRRYWPG